MSRVVGLRPKREKFVCLVRPDRWKRSTAVAGVRVGSLHVRPETYYSRRFDAEPSSAACVRKYVRESLDHWKVRSDEAVFLANELATNAIVHARSDFLVEVSLYDSTCRIEVVDHDPTEPRESVTNNSTPSGRGLLLVRALSRSWGVESRDEGKGVWCDIAVSLGS
jgi:anti-sigma regulatory factor (Ser/Thr protein kinase)